MALAFLPIEEVASTFDILDNLIREQIPATLNEFLDYYRSQWMNNIPYWNVHSHHLRTNNDIEGWHFAMKRSLKRPHPDIFTFIDWMRNEELYSRNIVAKSDPGQDVKRYNAVYDKINNDLTLLQDEYVHKLRSRFSL